MNKNASDKRPR